ncbi:tRNA (guanine-N(7)-)-methyltransferase [Bombiscardovia apis]|uniref:tRNA (guanine-N(7)-)-methyltransferase n=1 Tax=Bombiscardovia apis TaxID=2932182 RepID=A0ABM8BDU1_9BIFI|nr:tRNA (guanosine(46)-N7)-methyltransferase TrmB [Bombiscardovia apis]BDR55047.1 tRNA (guanine-N(7)-)-methyltransferase [Bombiscardovia apis]
MTTKQTDEQAVEQDSFGVQSAREEQSGQAGRRTIVSFTRRSGKLDDRLARAWQEYAPQLLLQLDDDASSLGVGQHVRIDQDFLERSYAQPAPVTVEIGSGQGENIVAAAAAHPDRNFLALEVYEPGLAHTMLLAGKQGLTNLKVAQTNAPEFFAAADQGSVGEVWTFFPDPWPKMKHHKRRLVQSALAADIARALPSQGLWRIATDIDDYALHVHEVMDNDAHFRNLGEHCVSLATAHVGKGTADQAALLPHADFTESERFSGRVLTNFERKGLAAGHTIHDFTYQVTHN